MCRCTITFCHSKYSVRILKVEQIGLSCYTTKCEIKCIFCGMRVISEVDLILHQVALVARALTI